MVRREVFIISLALLGGALICLAFRWERAANVFIILEALVAMMSVLGSD